MGSILNNFTPASGKEHEGKGLEADSRMKNHCWQCFQKLCCKHSENRGHLFVL
jgi:hypothetical protein